MGQKISEFVICAFFVLCLVVFAVIAVYAAYTLCAALIEDMIDQHIERKERKQKQNRKKGGY